jgi:hypothetical protein
METIPKFKKATLHSLHKFSTFFWDEFDYNSSSINIRTVVESGTREAIAANLNNVEIRNAAKKWNYVTFEFRGIYPL